MKKVAYRCWWLTGLVLAVVGLAVFLGACSGNNAPSAQVALDTAAPPAAPVAAPAGTSATVNQTLCPVTGEAIDKNQFVDYQGRRVYFCCPMCVDTFRGDPAKYLAILDGQQPAATSGMAGMTGNTPATPAPAAAHSGHTHGGTATTGMYTCSMHPEVVANAPGNCPKCGMNLVPKH